MRNYLFKGISLSPADMCSIKNYYEASSTAEYIMENYPFLNLDEEMALDFGYGVRRSMDKYGLSEDEAIIKNASIELGLTM